MNACYSIEMNYFRVEHLLELGMPCEIGSEAAHHMSAVRRLREGDMVVVQDTTSARFEAQIEKAERRSLTLVPRERIPLPALPNVTLTLLQACTSHVTLDLIFQKATELGVAHIRLFNSERSPHRIEEEVFRRKMDHWNKLLDNACEQSGRAANPTIDYFDSLVHAVADTPEPLFVLDISGSKPSQSDLTTASLVVGPEGGLTDAEKDFLLLRRATPLSLGVNMLRADTAAIVGCGVLIA